MKFSYFFTFLSLYLLNDVTSAAGTSSRYHHSNKKIEQTKREILPKLNSDLLPSLEDLLVELELSHRKNQMIKMGISETRHLLRLKSMDYQMMVRIYPISLPSLSLSLSLSLDISLSRLPYLKS